MLTLVAPTQDWVLATRVCHQQSPKAGFAAIIPLVEILIIFDACLHTGDDVSIDLEILLKMLGGRPPR